MLIRVRGKGARRHVTRGDFVEAVEYPKDVERPKTRGECEDGQRPCPFVSCRHHLFLDVLENGNIQTRANEVEDLPETCALDVADRGPQALETVGEIIARTRELVRQLQNNALRRARMFKVKPLADYKPEPRTR